MGYIKEPEGIDFVVENRPLKEKEKKEISDFIRKYKERKKSQNRKSRKKTKH